MTDPPLPPLALALPSLLSLCVCLSGPSLLSHLCFFILFHLC